ncbi:hypothetical protein CY658_03015 [Variovorax sp. RO1]|uniref:hypothetical protein n=1 Tax=Variovorax sp. RO1 TaxID=2066034 RepID=UPI000C7172F8|nr:hypothetical protein [Variovorax sp. RO1]PLC06034.1 hypothetical protein CY658_03015 [Variovorax sp. RO1]
MTQSVSFCPIWAMEASEKAGRMLGEIGQANTILGKVSTTAQGAAIKGGFAAETWHAESFNLDAILKDKEVRAFTDNFVKTPLARNDMTHDIVVMKGDEQLLGAQLKYFKDADATQKAFRSTKDGVHKYQNSDLFLGPSDQIEGVRISAQRDVLKNQQTRPEVSQAAQKVRDNTAGHLDAGGAQSTPLSKQDAQHLGTASKTGKDLHENMQAGYMNRATVQQSMRAAGSAAIITTVIAGSINTFQYLRQARDGQITAEQATLKILQNTAIAAGDSALKAGVASASVSVAARSMPGLFTGTVFKRSFANGGVAAAAVCAVDLVQCLVMFSVGRMTLEELETRTGKNLFQAGTGLTGAAVGTAVGALGGPVGALVGSIIGGLITTLAASIALDNHIEKDFQLTLASTEQVVSSGIDMQEALGYLQVSQVFYADFYKGLYLSERHFASQMTTMAAQSARLQIKIKNL